MSLASKLSHEFSTAVRTRGLKYERKGAVEIVNHTRALIAAFVRGAEYYQVSLKLAATTLDVACTCPYFVGGEACKHIWATMLVADENLYLLDANSRSKLQLRFDNGALSELPAVSPANDSLPLTKNRSAVSAKPLPEPIWKAQLARLANSVRASLGEERDSWPLGREHFYLIDAAESESRGQLVLDVAFRERTIKGEWGKIKTQNISSRQIPTIKSDVDREILTMLAGGRGSYVSGYYNPYISDSISRCHLSPELLQLVLPLICATGRCLLRQTDKNATMPVIQCDDGNAWELYLTARRDAEREEYLLRGLLRRGDEEAELAAQALVVEGLAISRDFRAVPVNTPGAYAWINVLKRGGEVRIPADSADDLLEQLLALPSIPVLELADDLKFESIRLPLTPHLVMRRPAYVYAHQLEVQLSFEYGETSVPFTDSRDGIYERASRRFILRDREAEQHAIERLRPLGFKFVAGYGEQRRRLELAPGNLPRAVKALLADGWKVEAEGKLYRTPGAMSMAVSSGIDWFELHGSVEFGEGLQAQLPALLSALKRGETMVQLGDGSFGLLPETWLKKYGLLASLGETEADHLRFKQTQTGVLDALLATQPEITCDEVFTRVRAEWGNFAGVEAVAPPKSFVGTLRDYQCEGLGWFAFLQRFGFGGCLADDMGLGKTVQVLALLEQRRLSWANADTDATLPEPSRQRRLKSFRPPAQGESAAPHTSLVVVPRSLIFNWQQEAARFTPQLRLLTHIGGDRTKDSDHFSDYDLVLTTYGTLLRDAVHFNEAEFDFVILDEAQAIKNAKTESAKAARLLKAKHRLALSGTPIENHLGELWSLFEFLNPGMLGGPAVFQLSANGTRAPDGETRNLLARALRPFILRRTKQQVAKELPEKLEQTIFCEMEPAQQKHYDELRDYYRGSLLDRVKSVGINRAKMHILEALLRLRQAACHPALITKSAGTEPSAKLDVLLPQLLEVTEEGHKALVFSQFTSFLAIVRERLDREKVKYEYLDGKTRDRAARVERFQTDPECKLFLISLKAGGLGLNLTAAEYVFLLDPWWNPAVEAQAIDRAHRIGQSQRVFAYRLITRGTVEEKVLALQETKRDLADSILSADNNLIKNITKDDLLLLLS